MMDEYHLKDVTVEAKDIAQSTGYEDLICPTVNLVAFRLESLLNLASIRRQRWSF